MLHLALDADAFLFLRSLGLLDDLIALARPQPKVTLHLTGFVARHELSDVAPLLAQLENEKLLAVSPLKTKTPAYQLFRKLLQEGYDKGESELGAWVATAAPKGTILVSCDKEVPKLSKRLKIRSVDLAQLVIILVKDKLLLEKTATERLASWDNPHTGLGRPKDWKSLTVALAGAHPLA